MDIPVYGLVVGRELRSVPWVRNDFIDGLFNCVGTKDKGCRLHEIPRRDVRDGRSGGDTKK